MRRESGIVTGPRSSSPRMYGGKSDPGRDAMQPCELAHETSAFQLSL